MMLRPVLYIVFCFLALQLKAQQAPQLPDMAGAAVNGVCLLQFDNPYEGLRSIDLYRSADSINGYIRISRLAAPAKGFNRMSDTLPLAGVNYYRVQVVFENGLSWTCNTLRLPPGGKAIAKAPITLAKPQAAPPKPIIAAPVEPKPTQSNSTDGKAPVLKEEKKSKRVGLFKWMNHNDSTISDAANYFTSAYISVDRTTGHVLINLPDVKKYPYTISFYSQDNRKVLDLPAMHSSPILLDKKNFQQKGTYHFVIYKSGKPFDQGYIVLQ
jgi:hypothetical protein